MVKKVKGLKVTNPQLQQTHKFTQEGDSHIGNDPTHSHEVTGTLATSADVNLDGNMVLEDRLAGFLFSPPHIDGAETDKINELISGSSDRFHNLRSKLKVLKSNQFFTPPKPNNKSSQYGIFIFAEQ